MAFREYLPDDGDDPPLSHPKRCTPLLVLRLQTVHESSSQSDESMLVSQRPPCSLTSLLRSTPPVPVSLLLDVAPDDAPRSEMDGGETPTVLFFCFLFLFLTPYSTEYVPLGCSSPPLLKATVLDRCRGSHCSEAAVRGDTEVSVVCAVPTSGCTPSWKDLASP